MVLDAVAPKRPGRPRGVPPPPKHLLTGRIRHLVDVAHSGNLADACRLTMVSYPTLSSLYLGSSVAPNLRTLEAIGSPYGLDAAWFVDEDEPGAIPVLGKVGLAPPDPKDHKGKRSLREVLIPFAAWPMFELFRRLEIQLGDLDPTAERPIVGEAGADAFTFRLTTFLLQPLLNAERLGLVRIPAAVDPAAGGQTAASPVDPQWVARLRAVGEMWEAVLQPLLSSEATI